MATQADTTAAAAASVAAYQSSTISLREQIAAQLAALWASLGSYRDAQLVDFVHSWMPILTGAEQHMSALTRAFLADQKRITVGGSGTPATIRLADVTGPATRNGVPPQEVYSRPFHQVWRDLSNGVAFDKAVENGLKNAQKSAVSDLQRTKTLTSQAVISKDKTVTGYRRILEGPRNCGLCIVASTQRYHKKQLLPIHPGCDCGVAAIYGDHDPGHILNEDLLQEAHAAIEERFGTIDPGARAIDYRKILLVREHGELGPVLTVEGHKFTGREDLHMPDSHVTRGTRGTKPATDVDAARTTEQLQQTLAALERSLEKFDSPGTRARVEDLRAKIAARA